MSVLIVGTVAFDTIGTPLGRVRRALGGSAAYASISASFFGPVNLVGVVGQDFEAKYINMLKKRGINLEGLIVEKGKTFHWQGEYDWDFGDPKTLATDLNVLSKFKPVLPPEYRDCRYVFLANIDPVLQMEVLKQVRKPKLVVCDTMNYWIENNRPQLLKLLKKVDVFLLNESEARMLTKEASIIKVAQDVLKLGPKIVVIKRGEHGAVLFRHKSIFIMPAFLLESVFDPTGAGDTFAGGFLGYLADCQTVNIKSFKKAVVYGSIMATFAVEGFSVRRLVSINKQDVEKRVKEFRQRTYF